MHVQVRSKVRDEYTTYKRSSSSLHLSMMLIIHDPIQG